jgi:hypothetical protein
MAYKSEDMRLMGGVPGQQLFLYRSEDAAADVKVAGYFDAAVDEYHLDTGDVVIACSGAAHAGAVELLVVAVDGGVASVVGAA